ncbi:MAG: SusC/RagA family TonB-linked outer membrane protein [Bacteroidales bacterium]|nr:SusC/RagA family TonB-linked outer membrane protein [Bacteroidales bacterium]
MNRIMTLCASVVLSCIMGVSVFAQGGYEVRGVVSDELGPVIGATVLEQGTTNGASTGIDGDYLLVVSSADAIIEISCIGYATQTFPASQVPQNVILSEDTQFLDEVVVIGYGSQKKKEVTGSVASVKSEDFNAGVKTSPVGLLQGKVAGLNIIRTTSDPTSTGFNVQIRGFSTLDKGAGTSPLYIVDGVPVSNIDNISPDEIASMDVLKDGSAAAIYGTRGTNGVIIITTKRGDNFSDVANTRVEYSGYASVSMRNGDMGMATPEEFRNLATLSNGAISPVIYAATDGNAYNTDWVEAMCRPAAMTHNHNVAIVGSSSKFNYRASIAYKNAEGIAKNNNREEMIAKIAASQKALDGWLELQYDLSYMHYRNDYNCGNFKQAAIMNPTYPIYDSANANGFFMPSGTGTSNPVEQMMQKESYGNGNFFRGSVKATVNIKPVKGLRVSGFAAIEEGDNRNFWYNRTINTDETGSGMGGRGSDFSFTKLFEVTADYSRSFGQHHVAGVAGFSYQKFLYDGQNIENKGFPTDDAKYFQIGNGDASKKYLNASSYRNSNALAAVFGRVNYNYAEKYLVSASIRREGSSRFGANNKWGWFPAVSLGWRITGEDFMEGKDWCNDLKLRAGFGVTGNNLGSDLKSVAMLSNGGSFWYNGQYVYTYGVSQNVNPDLRWEKKYEYNLGLDYAFLDNRIYGSLDVYYRQTRDLLWDYEVPTPPYQYPTLLANAGQMDSYGVELAISGVPVQTKDWTWVTTPTISFNKNIITKLSDPSKGFNYTKTTSGGVGENGIMNTNVQLLTEGEAVGSFYGYSFAGYKSDGTAMFNTPTGGYIQAVNASEGHKQIIGNAQPLFTYGWNNTIRWKNLDATLFFRGVVGNKILNVTRWAYGPQKSASTNIFMKDAVGSDVKYSDKGHFTDQYLEDGSYIKLDNVTIGYNFKFKENKYIESLRVYLTAQNVFTITKYSGQDPEVNTTGVWDAGIDYPDFYPNVATVLLGVNISLF